ncbi:MAG: GNAT family N-acetyltransferase [Alphaproteobacteria bacterium]
MNAAEYTGDYRCALVDPARPEAAIELIARAFSRDEPLAVTAGQSHEELTAMLGLFLPAAVHDGLTMGVYDDRRLVGAALTTAFTFSPPPEAEGASPGYPPIGALIETLERDFERANAARLAGCAHIHMLAVDNAARGRGIAQRLVDATARNAQAKGFSAIVADATNPTSQHVFANQGFETRNEIRYDSFVHDGTRRFAAIANLGAIKLMEKRL